MSDREESRWHARFDAEELARAEWAATLSHKSRAGNKDHDWVFAGSTRLTGTDTIIETERCAGCARTRRVYASTGKVYRP